MSDADAEPLEMVLYEIHSGHGLEWVPAPSVRAWMDEVPLGAAWRCVPLMMANESGWLLLNNARVAARWDGDPEHHVEFQYSSRPIAEAAAQARAAGLTGAAGPAFPHSAFGNGIVSWYVPYVVRTAPGFNLLVRGLSNHPKHGAAPLEGVVETDWAETTFTINWKLTRPDEWVMWEAGEALGMIVPQRRGDLEQFAPVIRPIESNPDLLAAVVGLDERRMAAHAAWRPGQPAPRWDYYQGRRLDGSQFEQHQTRLKLRDVQSDARDARPGGR